MLKISNISKAINNKLILHTINLEIASGSIAFLLGESGVGKSTLLRILNNLDSYDSGTITLNNKVLDTSKVHKDIGMVFQHFNLFPHITVQQNITLALEKVYHKTSQEAHDIAYQLLKKYKLENKATLPVSSLSGGQKQRLAIARALAINPHVICFDEPTSALDPLLTNHVAQEIQQLATEGKIVIVATHDMNFVLNGTMKGIIHLMKSGTIVETIPVEDIKISCLQDTYLAHFMSGRNNESVDTNHDE